MIRVTTVRVLILLVCAVGALTWWLGGGGIWTLARPLPKAVADGHEPTPGITEDRKLPIIFVGGIARSGTTLMRSILDSHPDVRCGQEMPIIPLVYQLGQFWTRSKNDSLREMGVTKLEMDNAIAAFTAELIKHHGEYAPRFCDKDPLLPKMASYIFDLFPKSKFIFMVRDGRATIHSIMTRKVNRTGFDLTSHRQCFQRWNYQVKIMYMECSAVGPDNCLMVRYESLVLRTEKTLRRVAAFLELPWDDALMHHEEYINKPHGVALSPMEVLSEAILDPVNLNAMAKWVGKLPDDVRDEMADLAPMLSVLGYDPTANPPRYETLPAFPAHAHVQTNKI